MLCLCCLTALQLFFLLFFFLAFLFFPPPPLPPLQLINVKVSEAHKIAKKVNRKYVYSTELHHLTCVQLRNSYNICCHLNRKDCVDPDGNSLGYPVERNDELSVEMDCSK